MACTIQWTRRIFSTFQTMVWQLSAGIISYSFCSFGYSRSIEQKCPENGTWPFVKKWQTQKLLLIKRPKTIQQGFTFDVAIITASSEEVGVYVSVFPAEKYDTYLHPHSKKVLNKTKNNLNFWIIHFLNFKMMQKNLGN